MQSDVVEDEGEVAVRMSTGNWYLLKEDPENKKAFILEGGFGDRYRLQTDKPVSLRGGQDHHARTEVSGSCEVRRSFSSDLRPLSYLPGFADHHCQAPSHVLKGCVRSAGEELQHEDAAADILSP